jgi:hypothetical protein
MRIAVLLAVGLALTAGVVHAQSDDEDEMDYYPLVPTGNSLRFGLRYVGGPKVAFSNVGIVPVNNPIVDTTSLLGRTYNDGYVSPSNSTRNDSNGRPPNDGLTNVWQVNYASQITAGGDVAQHLYSTNTTGAALKGRSLSLAGWELQAGRSLGKIARKVDVSLVAGISFSSMNAKAGGTAPAQLVTLTDVFTLNGQTPPSTLPYTAPTGMTVNVVDANGNTVYDANGNPQTTNLPTSLLLSQQPTRTTTLGTANVNGHWQVKGAYYAFRVGPMFQLPLTERLKISFGAGAALAYVGTDYTVSEQIELDEVLSPVQTAELDHRNVLLPAFYADLDAEYWLTERAGFYLGATYQKSKTFEQTLGGRTATIDLGTTSGLTTGVTLRF